MPLGSLQLMSLRERLATACYLLPALTLLLFGVRYLTASEFMPYHETGMQRAWSELMPHEQGVMLASLRGGGGGFVLGGVAILVLVAIPFRRGEPWAYKATPAFVLLTSASALYTSLTLTLLTPASAPWPAALATACLAALGFALAPRPTKQHTRR